MIFHTDGIHLQILLCITLLCIMIGIAHVQELVVKVKATLERFCVYMSAREKSKQRDFLVVACLFVILHACFYAHMKYFNDKSQFWYGAYLKL